MPDGAQVLSEKVNTSECDFFPAIRSDEESENQDDEDI